MNNCSVTFLPEEKTARVRKGETLLKAAIEADVKINSVCGGDGICGKCLVRVESGAVTTKPSMFLHRHQQQNGVVLACQTSVEGDAVVEVLQESRVGRAPQSASEDAIRYGRVTDWVGEGSPFPYDPLTHKQYLELAAPSGTDNASDQERVFRALRQRESRPTTLMDLPVLQTLPGLLRQSDWKVTALLGYRGGALEVLDVESGDTSSRNLGIAVDVGTTTLAAHLVDVGTSETIAAKVKYNSQARFGQDVISRIMYAKTNSQLRELQEAVIGDINELIAGLVVGARVNLRDVTFVLCAGNTTMTHLLLGLDPSHIRRDPYVPCASLPPTVRAADVGIRINPRGLLSVLPSVSSYVGGDVVADVLVSGMAHSSDVSLMIDLGTNGELVLGNSEWLICCSASAGPAFEGGGIRCGMHATSGAVERIELGPGGRVLDFGVVGGGKPVGLCGSAIIDIVGELLRVGCIDRRGRFLADACGPRLKEDEIGDKEFALFPVDETAHGREIVITEADISNLIHSKGAIYMAAECLLEYVDMQFADLSHIYLAGGFGNHLRIDEGIAIGLLPDVDPGIFRNIGNGSVQGAKVALLSQEALRYLQESIASSMTYLELSTYHKFMNEYSSCLFLPHTNIEKFPSVNGRRSRLRTRDAIAMGASG